MRDVAENPGTKQVSEAPEHQPDAILQAVCLAAERLLKSSRIDDCFRPVLAGLGEATNVSRVYVFENRPQELDAEEIHTSQICEWAAPGIEPQMGKPFMRDFPMRSGGFVRWFDLMSRGEPVHGLVSEFPPSERDILVAQEILSLAAVPVFSDDRWWGFIGFDDCDSERHWSAVELDALRTAASIFGAALEQRKARLALQASHERLESAVVERTRELQRERDALRQIQRRFRTALDNTPMVLWTTDRTGQFTLSEGKGLESLGLKPGQVVGRCLFEIYRDAPDIIEHNRRALAGEEVTATLEVDGVVFDAHCAPLRDAHGAVEGIIGVALDVTERHQTERQLEETARQLRAKNDELEVALQAAQQATALKTRFLANISHELRTPMNGMIGMTELLLDTPLTTQQRGFAEAVKDSSECLLGILNDILDVSKIEAGRFDIKSEPFVPGRIVNAVSQLFGPAAQAKGLKLSLNIDQSVDHSLLGDPGRIRQVLNNLVGNAIKFTDGGEIEIRVDCQKSDSGSLTALYAVRDTGIGIARDQLESVFESFVQGDDSPTRRHGGAGLGLAISKQLVELMGGEIGCESEVDRGSTFWFILTHRKRKEAEPPPDAAKTPAMEVPDHHGVAREFRILIAEDQSVNRMLALGILQRLGYQADGVSNGREAVEALRRSHYDLVLMDVQMPEMDGICATRQIRCLDSGRARIPIVAMTASAMPGDREQCLDAGMDDYICKPIARAEVNQILKRWLHKTSNP